MTVSLLVNDRMNSPQLSRSNVRGVSTHRYSPFGAAQPADAADSMPGFNGQRRDPVSHSYHLGNGYRAYNPILMRFNCPDSLSPFGAGGINPYTYCLGDPVNRADPSGHISWQAGLGIGLGILGIIATAGAASMGIAAAGGIGAALSAASGTSLIMGGVGVVADATAIASGAVEDVNPQASSVLGWVSMTAGIAGMAAGVGAVFTAKGRKAINPPASTSYRASPEVSAFEYISNPNNFNHEVSMKSRILSYSKNTDSRFINKYTPNRWYFEDNYRQSNEPIYFSDMIQYQYKIISNRNKFHGQLPKEIARCTVINRETLNKTEGLIGSPLMKRFMTETVNGKSTQRVLDTFGLRAKAVTRSLRPYADYPDFIVSVE